MNRRMHLAAAVMTATALTLPSAASAATAAVTGDDGQPIPLSAAPTQIRNMSPEVALSFDAATETKYSILVTAPDGSTVANLGAYCLSTSSYEPEKVKYLGNGTYTVTIRTGKGNCTDNTVTTSFAIQASTSIAQPTGSLLTRRPDQSTSIDYYVPIAANPGADDTEVRFARNAVLGPDGGIMGTSYRASFDPASSKATVNFFDGPGVYTIVSRANDYTGASTAWSPAVKVRVRAPFDFVTEPYFADSRGPSYKITGLVREKTAAGRMTVYLAKGRKGGKFHKLRTVKVRHGNWSLRFNLHRRGTYRLKYSWKGSSTVAPGYVIQGIRIKRVFF